MKKLKKYIVFIILMLLVICWVGFIWGNSMKDGTQSGAESSKVCEVVNDVSQSLGVEEPISEHTVRKSAHFGEYMVLGFLVCADMVALCAARSPRREWVRILLLSISVPFSALVASIDEFCIQANVEGRGPAFTDVLIDTAGALSALAITVLIIYIVQLFKKIKRKPKKNKNKKEKKKS